MHEGVGNEIAVKIIPLQPDFSAQQIETHIRPFLRKSLSETLLQGFYSFLSIEGAWASSINRAHGLGSYVAPRSESERKPQSFRGA